MGEEMNRKKLNEDDSPDEIERKKRFERPGEDDGAEVEGHRRVNYGTERFYDPVEKKA